MSNTQDSQGFVAIFLLVMVLIGAVTGTAIGAALAGTMHLRWLAVLSALLVIIFLGTIRTRLGRLFPKLSLARRGSSIPSAVWIGGFYSAIVGGLAGHDFGQLAGIYSAPLVGFFSGTIAAVSMSALMILYFRNHPGQGVEF
jgi:uncharacterized membrane protein YfcA